MTERNDTTERVLLVVLPLSMIVDLGWKLLSSDDGREWPSPTVTFLEVGFEILGLVSLVWLSVRRLKSKPRPGDLGGAWAILPVMGLVAGLGLLALHLTGPSRGEFPPRSSQFESDSSADALPPELEKLGTRLKEFIEGYEKAEAEMLQTRVAQTMEKAPSDLGKLSREDVQTHGVKQRALIDSIDRGIQFLSEPGVSDKIDRLYRQDGARRFMKGLKRSEFGLRRWQLIRKIWGATDAVTTVMSENWDEWRSIESFPPEAEQKPWQKEIRRLQGEVDLAKKELEELVGSLDVKTTPAKPTPDPQQAEFARLKKELQAVHASFKSRWETLLGTRWAKTESEDEAEGRNYSYATMIPGVIPQLRKLSREDLSEFRKAQRALLESYEQAFRLFGQVKTKGVDPFNPGVSLSGWYRTPAMWKAAHHAHTIAYTQSELLEQNWEDWRRSGPNPKGTQKPWQKKVRQLQDEFSAAMDALSAATD